MEVRKLIRARKRAAAVHVQVGVHDPKGRISIVDLGDEICPRVDLNFGLAAGTIQLI